MVVPTAAPAPSAPGTSVEVAGGPVGAATTTTGPSAAAVTNVKVKAARKDHALAKVGVGVNVPLLAQTSVNEDTRVAHQYAPIRFLEDILSNYGQDLAIMRASGKARYHVGKGGIISVGANSVFTHKARREARV